MSTITLDRALFELALENLQALRAHDSRSVAQRAKQAFDALDVACVERVQERRIRSAVQVLSDATGEVYTCHSSAIARALSALTGDAEPTEPR